MASILNGSVSLHGDILLGPANLLIVIVLIAAEILVALINIVVDLYAGV